MKISKNISSNFDVIICGAGHAGCEAALASSRIGAKTLILTGNLDTIAKYCIFCHCTYLLPLDSSCL